MSLVFCASRNVSFNEDNHILKFSTNVLENLLSSFFFNSENQSSILEQSTWLHLYLPFGKFHLVIRNKRADNNGTALPHETDFDITKDRFCWNDIFARWFEDYQMPYQLVRQVHMKIICWGFHGKTSFTFWDMRTWDMWKFCLQTFRNNRIC